MKLRFKSPLKTLAARLALHNAVLFGIALLAAMLTIKGAVEAQTPILPALTGVTIVALVLLIGGGWALAQGLSRPILALDEALERLQKGERVEVALSSRDEVSRMARRAVIAARERLKPSVDVLPDRASLEADADACGREGCWIAVIGVDRFETVRGAIGYRLSEELLAALARRLTALAEGREVAHVATGDLGLVFEAPGPTQALRFAQRLCEAGEAPIRLNETAVDVVLSAGVASLAPGGPPALAPVDRAAIALDQARAARVRAAVFSPEAYGDPAANLSLISEMMSAMREGQLSLAYQPKYDFHDDRITGAEALTRWAHPTRGDVSPDLFISMAEETGHIRPMTEWLLRQAIADQAALRARGHAIRMSLNVSGRLLSDDAFADFALAEITAADADLCFEITETSVIDNPSTALAIVERLSDAGVRVSIDDYGSGLSSLGYLKRLRADELKIDKSFILSLGEHRRDALLVKSTVDLAHSLGLRVTAEGVENPMAMALLRGMGCDMAQGYFIGRPMSLDELAALLDQAAPEARDASSAA